MDDSRVKILYYSEGWGYGGIERFIMNTVSQLDPREFSFDIFCTHDWADAYDEDITRLGGTRKVVFKGHKPGFATRLRASTRAWEEMIEDGGYDVVHVNTMNGVGLVYAHIARQHGVPVRIVHAHNSGFGAGGRAIKQVAHTLGKSRYGDDPTIRFAVSSEAGSYLFDGRPFSVLPNTVDEDRFAFDSEAREGMRAAYGIPSESLVFGSCGRIAEAKNPLFQIDVLSRVVKDRPDAFLLLIGDGPLSADAKAHARELGIEDRLVMPGSTNEVERALSAFDVMTMPSEFEGLPMALLESLANGLPCVVSRAVPPLMREPPSVRRLALGDAAACARTVLEACESTSASERMKGPDTVRMMGYGKTSNMAELKSAYRQTRMD